MNQNKPLSRRGFLLGSAALAGLTLAGCAATGKQSVLAARRLQIDPAYLRMYAPVPTEPFPIPAMDIAQIDPKYWRQVVSYPTSERPGTVVVDTANFFLYHVMEGGQATRYGVGVGREGFAWSGRGVVAYKKPWPTWTPPAEMIRRQPQLEQWRQGMPPGLTNPLGARALYIFRNGRDTGYRLHGTAEVASIGKAVSSGCIRLLNQDVIDLYERVVSGSAVLVI